MLCSMTRRRKLLIYRAAKLATDNEDTSSHAMDYEQVGPASIVLSVHAYMLLPVPAACIWPSATDCSSASFGRVGAVSLICNL